MIATLPSDLLGQSGSLIPVDHWSYQYIERLQRRGQLLDLHPTRLPYSYGELRNALAKADYSDGADSIWIEALKEFVGSGESNVGLVAEAQADLINSERKDLLRPLGDGAQLFSKVHLRMHLESKGFVGQIGGSHDLYYDEDPDGLDAANRLIARNEESYLGYTSKWFKAYLGRYKNHWAPLGQTALLLSDNAHAFDLLGMRFGSNMLSVSAVYGELDSWSTRLGYTGRAGNRGSGESETPIRRYLSAHRIDWRPIPNLSLSFMESSIVSGPNAGISLRYLNPLSNFLLLVDNSPKNEENNGFVAGSLWANFNRFTFQGQLLIDDLDLKFGDEPGSIALAANGVYSGFDLAEFGFNFDLVSGRVYNTEQEEGQYLYLLRGIGTQFNDYVSYGAFLEIFPVFLKGGFLRMNLDLLQVDEDGRINKPFPADNAAFLFDTEKGRTLRESISVFFRPTPWALIEANFGYSHIQNPDPGCVACEEALIERRIDRSTGLIKLKIDFSRMKKMTSW